jgi:hypothetical protein
MTGTSPSAPQPRCATPYCGCGRCYSPGSLVGDWVSGRLRGAWRTVRRAVLRRPHRYRYDERGGLLLPAWVSALWDGDLVGDERA